MKRIAVLISGSGSNLQSIIDQINAGYIPAKIDLVISDRKNAFGLQRAKNENIDTLYISKLQYPDPENFDRQIIAQLQSRKIDLIVLAGYLKILSPYFVKCFPYKIINIHPALIPSFCGNGYYGLGVHQAILDYGAKVSGATVHFVDEGTDTGAIILQKSLDISENESAESLQKKVLQIEHTLLPRAIKLFCEEKLIIEEKTGSRTKIKIID